MTMNRRHVLVSYDGVCCGGLCEGGKGRDVANQVCKNTAGSHTCQCKDGFVYDYESQTCTGEL